MWIVRLVKAPIQNDFRVDFFPRKFHFKDDAMRLALEVERKGGEARIENSNNPRRSIEYDHLEKI
jgi:hypothetical protein